MNDYIEIEVFIHRDTGPGGAYLISNTGDIDDAVWIPVSQCERDDYQEGKSQTIGIKEWIATREGLI